VTKSGTLTFITDDTEETIAVQVNGDWSYEANETFSVNLSSPTFAAISDGSGLGTILNDDINPPTGLTAAGVSMTQINLNWSDNSPDETAFYVERSPNGTAGWTEIGSVGANVTTYPDSTGLACGTTYFYRVRAYRSGDNQYSAYSDPASAQTINECPPPLIAPANGALFNDNTPTFVWDSMAWAVMYRIQVDDDPAFDSPAVNEIVSATTYTPSRHWRMGCTPGAC
jgi:hypothetical protein